VTIANVVCAFSSLDDPNFFRVTRGANTRTPFYYYHHFSINNSSYATATTFYEKIKQRQQLENAETKAAATKLISIKKKIAARAVTIKSATVITTTRAVTVVTTATAVTATTLATATAIATITGRA